MDFKQWLLKNIGLSLIAVLALVIFIAFLGNDISDHVVLIGGRRQDLMLRINAFNSFASLRSDARKAEELLILLEEALPTKDQLIGFSNALEDLAKDNKLDFGFSFEAESPATETMPGTNSFTVTSKGSYKNFADFLASIEDSRYFVKFNLIDLVEKNDDFEIIMKGEVFSR